MFPTGPYVWSLIPSLIVSLIGSYGWFVSIQEAGSMKGSSTLVQQSCVSSIQLDLMAF